MGAHSTGKTTFANQLAERLAGNHISIGRVCNLARESSAIGFPILSHHTIESTSWIVATCIQREAELSLTSDVIIIDRPVLDAIGYLRAALTTRSLSLDSDRLRRLEAIAHAHTSNYDLLFGTVLDRAIPLGLGRDADPQFRALAAANIATLGDQATPRARALSPDNFDLMLRIAVEEVLSRLGRESNETDFH